MVALPQRRQGARLRYRILFGQPSRGPEGLRRSTRQSSPPLPRTGRLYGMRRPATSVGSTRLGLTRPRGKEPRGQQLGLLSNLYSSRMSGKSDDWPDRAADPAV